MTINDFVKLIKLMSPNAVYKATSPDGIVFKGKNWLPEYEDDDKIEVIPFVAKPMEKKRGR